MNFLDELLKDVENSKEIIEKIKGEVGKSYVPKSDFNGKNEELKEVKEQLKERDTQLNELGSKVKDNEELTKTIEELQETNTKTTEEYEAKIQAINKTNSIEKAISTSELNFLDTDIVKSLVNQESILINDDGITGLKEQLEKIAEEKPFLCKTEKEGDSNEGDKLDIITGKNRKVNTKMTKEEFVNLNYFDRAKLKETNEALYNKLMK